MNQSLKSDRVACRYRFGTAEFNEARFELRVAGLVVETEKRALEVLNYLLRHAGEVVTKEEFQREVWAGRVTVEKVLTNAINKLRRALGEANAALISTQARIGYRLDGVVHRTVLEQHKASDFEFTVGQAVPGRDNFVLQTRFSQHRGSEVWLATHSKTREKRVYKFGAGAERLRSLKREATLAQVLQESLSDRSAFIEIIDWNFEHAPYFLECQYGGDNLQEWAAQHLAGFDINQRVELFLQILDAVAAAHSVGVLHKDLKPANVVVLACEDNGAGPALAQHWQIRVTDFGNGRLLDPDRLEELGISRLGMTVTQTMGADTSGTPLYVAPELFSGQASTVQSDVYALGIMLYQLLSAKLQQPMAPGWEADIDDAMLVEDLRLATDGNPARRFGGAAEFAARLRDREERRAQMKAREAFEARGLAAQQALTAANARRPYLFAFVAALVLSLISLLHLRHVAVLAKTQAEQALAEANAINRFINEDLIGQSNPLLLAKGQGTEVKDLLLAARNRMAGRFVNQPGTEASLRANLASLFLAIDLVPEAEAEARRALSLYETQKKSPAGQGVNLPALQMRALLARALARQSKFDEAKAELQRLDVQSASLQPLQRDALRSAPWGVYHTSRAEFAESVPHLQRAIEALKQLDPNNVAPRDWLRLELIAAYSPMQKIEAAQREGHALIADIKQRGDHSELMIALVQAALARSYTYQEKLDDAEKLLLEAQPVIAQQLGKTHARSITLSTDLMNVSFHRYDYDKALIYAEEIYRAVREKRGDHHASTYVTLGNWGRVFYELGNYAEAKQRLSEALTQLNKILGPDSGPSQDARFLLAATELGLGDWRRAEVLSKQLNLKALEAYLSHGLWQFGIDGINGLILDAKGDRKAALVLLEKSEKGLRPESKDERGDRIYHTVLAALRRK